MGVIYLILQGFTFILTEKCQLKGFESGQYGNPPSLSYWLRQAAVYVLALTMMKLLVIGLFAAWPGIFSVGTWLLSFLRSSDALEVILYVILSFHMLQIAHEFAVQCDGHLPDHHERAAILAH